MWIAVNNRIVKQLSTEKTHKLQESNVYVFLFPKGTRQEEIKALVEKKYAVKIDDIRVVNLPRKEKSFRGQIGVLTQYKKAYIKVARGMKIEVENDVKEG